MWFGGHDNEAEGDIEGEEESEKAVEGVNEVKGEREG